MSLDWPYDIEIVFADGTLELVHKVNKVQVLADQLHLFHVRDDYASTEKHLGSYPLVNIRRWRKIDVK